MRETMMWRAAALGATALLGAAACGDETAAGSGATATTTAASTSSGQGGSGGAPGAGGAGGAGGGAAVACLDPSAYEAWFSLKDASLCAVAAYDADVTLGFDADAGYYFRAPTWGRHGGPLTMSPARGGAVELARWALPAGPTGALTATRTTVDTGIPEGSFLGAQAIDLGFFGWTALGWTGQFPATQGELLAISDATVAKRYAVNGFYAGSVVALPGGDEGRVVYSGLSAIDDAEANENALYAADSCGASADDPRLLPAGDASCAAPVQVAAWGDSSGPVVADADGNMFGVFASFGADQEARGFAAETIARGAPATPGDSLFMLPGFGSSLAAIAPRDGDDGWLLFQGSSPDAPYDVLDVVGQRYVTMQGHVEAHGEPAALLALTTPNTGLELVSDDQNRLWVGAPRAGGGTTFVVLARAPKPSP